ncbi:MAG: hypothetical protein CXX83_00855 [Methanobacteriota archaeon]|nr:MAG: hypothetical protein CXX83_00855 [Euryarchaeota archaeon]
MKKGYTAISCALFLVLMMVSSIEFNEPLSPIYDEMRVGENSEHHNQSIGGLHIATNDWWQPSRPFNVTSIDWDGDGVTNGADTHPLDPAIASGYRIKGTACTDNQYPCLRDPTPTPFRSEPVIINPLGSHALSIEWGDINGDGSLDVVVGNSGSPNTLYLNDGIKLESIPTWVSPNSQVTMDIALGDIDGDGDLDLVEVNYEGPALIYRNIEGVFEDTPYWSYTFNNDYLDSTMSSVALGDVDNDGDLDMMLGIYYEGIELFLNNGNTFPSTPSWVRSTDRATLDIELSDINGDGYLDLIEGAAGEQNQIHLNSLGTFTNSPSWRSLQSYPTSSIALGDVDGDGDNDLVVGNRNEVNELFLNSGSGFSTIATWTSQNMSLTMDVTLADVDKDGDLDILDSTANEPNYIYTFDGVEFGDVFWETWASTDSGDSANSAWGDVDGDGDLDFVTADGVEGPILHINGGHNLDDVNAWSDGTNSYSYSIDLGDMDNDGDLDLAIGNGNGEDSSVWRNNGASFSMEWTSPASRNFFAEDIIWFDVDNDGYLDIIIGDDGGRNYAYAGNYAGSGSLSTTNHLWRSNSADDTYDLTIGDINGDGWDDLISVNYGYNRVYYSISTPSGYILEQQESWSSTEYDFSVCGAVGDINGDGYLDLFVANNYEYAKVYLNTGTGLETTASWSSQSTVDAQGCSMGDVDGDGDLDVVISTETTGNKLFLNYNGVLNRNPDWTTPESDDTLSIFLSDIDGDNDLDWVEGNYGLTKNRIRMNVNGSFTKTIWQSSDSLDTWDLAIADIDGDGDLDMAVANLHQINQIFTSHIDQDGDWISEEDFDFAPFDPTQISDFDNDGFGDRLEGWRPDDCPGYWGDSWRDRWGCPDLDRDGQSDLFDPFMQKPTQWSDLDGDGLGDNWVESTLNGTRGQRGLGQWVKDAFLPDPSPWDYDNDGYEDSALSDDGAIAPFDDCPFQHGSSSEDLYGCGDADLDGWSDSGDDLPGDPTQWEDTDGDGFGDQGRGNQPDACIMVAGTSTEDRYGCPDSDGDGWSDEFDYDQDDPLVWNDGDGDGFNDQNEDDCLNQKGSSIYDRQGCPDQDRDGWSDPDGGQSAHPIGSADAFPVDGTQWRNQDGDGYGDNPMGFEPDSCDAASGTSRFKVENAEFVDWFGCSDQDNDGLFDGDDDCQLVGGTSTIDRYGCPDSDGDGVSDANDDCELQAGDSTIQFTACPDTDGDGIPDSIDPVPSDGLGTADDWDADGWNQIVDAFPNDPTQWEDADGDGLGDNPDGNFPDPFPGDRDNDGYPDANDSFINNPNEWLDTDGDGTGDNADLDDDEDGYSDLLEAEAGTDPKDANDHPVESWEWIVPGTQMGLSMWDLLGVLAGLPIASWLAYGLVTRNERVARFEEELTQATTKEEIEEVAIRAEEALMYRLLGPHQAIRLERLRAELDDALDIEGFPPTQNQTALVLQEIEDDIDSEPEMIVTPEFTDDYEISESEGYEWKKSEGQFFYRIKDGDGEWHPWGD